MIDFDPLLFALAAVILVLFVQSNLSIWARRHLWIKVLILSTTVAGLLAFTAVSTELLGRPKVTTLEWANRNAEDAVVVASQAVEDEAIYLWLQLPDVKGPRAYKLPWNRRLAEQLMNAGQEAEANGTETRMRRPFQEESDESEPSVYAEPPLPLPPKATLQPGTERIH